MMTRKTGWGNMLLMASLIFCVPFAGAKTVQVDVAGTLADELDTELNTLTELTVTGTINATDFATMNSMSKLKYVDCSAATVVENSIPGSAFANNKTIETFIFPQIKNIGGGAFVGSALKGTVTFPKTLNGGGNIRSRFNNCQGVTAFAVEEGNTTIRIIDGVVFSVDGKTIVMYPCGNPASDWVIPEGAENFDAPQAAGYCHNLKTVTLPASFKAFNARAFEHSDNLEKVFVAEGNETFESMDGMLYNKTTRSLDYFPAGNKVESLVIDGSKVEVLPSSFFASAMSLKRVVFTEGVKELGYALFKSAGSPLVYVELPASLTKIGGEAFANCASLEQIICHGEVPAGFDVVNRNEKGLFMGSANFRGLPQTTKVGVPADAVDTYRNSFWCRTYKQDPYTNDVQGFIENQFVPFYEVEVENGTSFQSVALADTRVTVVADAPVAGEAFSKWTATPTVQFMNATRTTTDFIMPESNVKVTAVFAATRSYTIIDAITPSGKAAIGALVEIEAAPSMNGGVFSHWEIVEGDGLVLADPNSIVTTFVMIDGTVTIKACYSVVYTVIVANGTAKVNGVEALDVSPGETVTIEAATLPGKEFVEWTTPTAGVQIANPKQKVTTFVMPESDVEIMATFKEIEGGIDPAENVKVSVYPNPAVDRITISGEVKAYAVYDATGKVVMKDTDYRGGAIGVSHLPAGIYIVRTDAGAVTVNKR